MPHCSKMQVAAISCSYFAKLCFSYFANWPLWLSDSDTAMSNAKAIWRELSSVLEILACGYIYSMFHKTFFAFPTLTKCCSSRGGWMLQSCKIILKITLLPLWAQDWLWKKKRGGPGTEQCLDDTHLIYYFCSPVCLKAVYMNTFPWKEYSENLAIKKLDQ